MDIKKEVIKNSDKKIFCYNEMIILKYLAKLEIFFNNDDAALQYLE